MKKSLFGLTLVVSVLLLMTGCKGQTASLPDGAAQNPYYPDNEIITAEDLSDDRMVIVIDTQYNVSTTNINDVVESRFPEVNVLLRLQNTTDSPYYTKKSLEHDQMGDIFFCAVGLTKDEQLSEYFIDLSDAPFINNYYQNALDSVAINGKVYMLPGFSDIFGIIYDRTLFEERGWELPHSRDEFIALCAAIQAEEGYQAFMPTLKYSRMAMLLSHAFHYESVIAGFENQQWLQAYRRGEASFAGHMEPLFQGMKELLETGVLSDKNFTIDPGIRSAMLYTDHTSAMTMETQNAATYAQNAGSDHNYGMMPFWNSNSPDSDYVVSAPGFNIYANKRLERPENAEKLQKVMEILAYFSTPEGQQALMTKESASISNVKGTDITFGGASFMDGVAGTIAKGNIFPEVRYTELAFNNSFQVAFREALMGYVGGDMDMKTALAHCDAAMEALKNAVVPEETVYGTASRNFTVLETAEFVADVLREEAQADVALVLTNQLSYGETGKFYMGDITNTTLNLVTLDYVSGKVPEYNRLVTVDLTGEQILSIMNDPYLNSSVADTRTMWVKHDTHTYWMPSNLKIEYAPFLFENSIITIKNMDGSEFDLQKTYKVAIWNGCFSNLAETDYFDAATLAAMENVTVVSDKSSTELIKAAVMEAGEISPPDDGRFTIRWDITPQADAEQS